MKVVLTHPLAEAGMNILQKNGAEIFIANSSDPTTYLEQLKNTDIFIIRAGICSAAIIDACQKLKVIGKNGAGYDNIDVAYATSRGIPVVFTPGANANAVAEHCIADMFALSKNLFEANTEIHRGNWQIRDAGKSFELIGKKVGIIGLGAIGKRVAELCHNIGMKTAGYDVFLDKKQIVALGCEYYDSIDKLVAESDVITLHIPLTPKTKNTITLKQLKEMKKTAIVINCSRGSIVNEHDLVCALNNEVIAGAAVDVYEKEPVLPNNPLLTAKNIICTPHSAGLTREGTANMAIRCVRGCLAVYRGEQWQDIVDKNVYNK